MPLGQGGPVAGVGVEPVLGVALAPGVEHAAAGHHVDRGPLVGPAQQVDDHRGRGLPAADNADALGQVRAGTRCVLPVFAPGGHPRVGPRLPGHLDRWPGPGEHHAVRPQLGPAGQVEPPPVPHRLQTVDLRRDHLGSRLGGGVAQVEAPLPVGGTEPAAVDPVGVDAPLDQVPLKAKTGHRRGDRGRGIPPAVRVGETDVLLWWRAQRQQAGGVALPAGPVPGHRPGVDEHHPGRVQAGRGQGPRLDGDGDALRARARHGQRRHTREDNLRPTAATVS